MCGFVAITLPSGHPLDDAVQSTVAVATDLLRHRGPDDHGQLAVHGAAFGFRRLAILDRSLAGHQPMQTEDGRFTMVFNGEIYNYVELRRELTARGHIFRSSGDTEVLLRGFAEWGDGVFDRAAGMFAVCIHDAAHHTMTAVRDRFGIKPLFMCHTPRGWAFASEIKALRPLASSAWAANVPRWAMFLRDGRTEGLPESEETFVTGVDQVLPGTIVTVHADGSRRERIFWSPDQIEPDDTTTVDMVRNGLEQAVREHLRSDVPVGVLLSGGVDSSALACLGVHLTGGRGSSAIRHAFSYQSAAFDEGAQIDAVVAATGLSLHRIGDERVPDLFQTLRKVLWHHDEPFHGPNVLVSYDLYRMARAQGVPVVLNGQGSDEAFGGYYGGFGVQVLQSLWRQRRWLDLWRQAGATGAAIGGRGPLLRSLAVAQASRAIGDLAGMETLRRRVRARRNAAASHLSAGMQGMLPVTAPPGPEGEGMTPSLRFALANAPLPKYLAVDDRNSMAHGVESRVPFLDHRLVELALRLPLELQLWNGINKVAVRAALHGTVPAVVLDRRPKFGFPVDARRWFTGVLAGPLREILTDPLLARSGWIAPPAVERLLAEHRTGRHDHTDRLFALAQAAIWLDLQQQAR